MSHTREGFETLIRHWRDMKHQLRLSRFKLAGPPTPRDTEASNAYAILHDSLGPVCICSLIGINSYAPRRADDTCARTRVVRRRRVTGAPRHRDWSRRGAGLPGYGTVLFICAMVEHPAGDTPLLARTTSMQRGVVAFR